MPPAVEAEPPPTNMSMEPTMRVAPFRSPMSMTLKPPDLVIAERKNAWNVVSHASMLPNVRGLSYSRSRMNPAPSTKRMTVVMSVSFVCSDHSRKRQWCRHRVKMTGKPIEPRNTPSISTVRRK